MDGSEGRHEEVLVEERHDEARERQLQLVHVALDDCLRVHVARAQAERVHDAQLRAVDHVRHACARARRGDGAPVLYLVVVAVRVGEVRRRHNEAADGAGERRFKSGGIAGEIIGMAITLGVGDGLRLMRAVI